MADILGEKFLQQTAVYWASPKTDGIGGFTWADPVEIKCRWTDSTNVVTGRDGQELVSRAFVLVDRDLEEQGVLFLGTLLELDSTQEDDPTELDGALLIKRFDKIPDIPAKLFLRKAFL